MRDRQIERKRERYIYFIHPRGKFTILEMKHQNTTDRNSSTTDGTECGPNATPRADRALVRVRVQVRTDVDPIVERM